MRLAGGSAAAWPLAALAQQALPVIGYLDVGSADGSAPITAAFRRGLAQTGQVVGGNVAIKVSLGGWPQRSIARISSRFGSTESDRDCHARQHGCRARRESDDHNDPHHLRDRS